MKQAKYLFWLLAAVSLAGCKEDYLDVTPKGKMIFKTTDDYRKLLDFTTYNNVGELFTVTRTYGIACLLEEAYQITTEDQFRALIPTQPKYHKYCWAASGTLWQKLDEEEPEWRSLYQKIYLANVTLDGLPSAVGSENAKQQLEGECYVHRAFSYFALVNTYGKAYHPASSETDPGVPVRATTLLSEKLDRKTVGQVYECMVDDLNRAIALPLFADAEAFNHRPTKTAAYALLARVYLFMGKYAEAFQAAQEALNRKGDLYDLNVDMVLSTADPRYDATLWPVNGLRKDYPTKDKEAILWKEPTAVTSQYSAGYSVFTTNHDYLADLYDLTTDLRFNLFFNGTEAAGYTYTIARRYTGVYFHFIGVGVPEMVLTRAECLIRTGKWQEGVAEMENFRKKRIRIANYAPIPGVADAQTALEAVLKERERELVFKGMNYFDVKRRNALDNAGITLERTYFKEGQWIAGYKIDPEAGNWQMPIPPLYVSLNPEMKQNPGYFEEGK